MNTINLLSAISVLACNVSMATIPKQANTSNYGDIKTIDKRFYYSSSNTLSGDFDLEGTNYGYNVERFIGSYSDSAINFYSEMYYYTSYDSHYMDVRNIGCIVFFTLSIYDNTMLSEFRFKPSIGIDNTTWSGSFTRKEWSYNKSLDLTNLGNTLYFSNYNLNWQDNTDLPMVCYSNTGYLSQSSYVSNTFNSSITNAFNWDHVIGYYDNVHGSINYCYNQSIYLNDTLENGNTHYDGQYDCELLYKYYINNPTYEVIDLPNVMLSILTMPFTFFSQAFNLTLFPNTPYAINVGHTILIIVGVIGSIYLIKYLVGIFKG